MVILCVNSQEVDNVTQTFSFTMSKVLAHERFKCVKSYAGIEEETPVQLLNGCDFFMVTPSSLLRLLKKKQMTLGSLDHLVTHTRCFIAPVMRLCLHRLCHAARCMHNGYVMSALYIGVSRCQRPCGELP